MNDYEKSVIICLSRRNKPPINAKSFLCLVDYNLSFIISEIFNMDPLKIGLIVFVSTIAANEDFQNAEIMLGWLFFTLLFSKNLD